MNLPAYFTGALKALGRSDDWPRYFDLSRRGFWRSFLAILLMLPFLYTSALAVAEHWAAQPDTEITGQVPLPAFMIIFGLYALSFSVAVYVLTMLFDKQDRFRPWVIVRHWAFFFVVIIIGAIFGLAMAGLLPFLLATYLVFAMYLSTLMIDIRLAQKIGGFEWGAAILSACIFTAMGLTILLTGIAQFI